MQGLQQAAAGCQCLPLQRRRLILLILILTCRIPAPLSTWAVGSHPLHSLWGRRQEYGTYSGGISHTCPSAEHRIAAQAVDLGPSSADVLDEYQVCSAVLCLMLSHPACGQHADSGLGCCAGPPSAGCLESPGAQQGTGPWPTAGAPERCPRSCLGCPQMWGSRRGIPCAGAPGTRHA